MWFSFGTESRGGRIAHRAGATSSRRVRTSALESSLERLEERQLLSVSNVRVREGNAGLHQAVFHVILSPPINASQTYTISTFDLSAKANKDYIPPSIKSLTYAPGQTVMSVPVSIIGNTVHQHNRKFGLMVTDNLNRLAFGIATIIDDDPKPSHIRVSNPKVLEGNVGSSVVTPTPTTTTPTPTTTTPTPTTTTPTIPGIPTTPTPTPT